MQRKNCYIVDSCLRRCSKGQRPKSHSKALRGEIAETSRSCSFPPSPPTPLHPRRGDQGSSTTIFGQRFVRGGVHGQRPTFKLAGNQGPGNWVDAACVYFEGWRLTVNSTTFNTRPHRAVELTSSPRRGWRGVGGEGGTEQGVETSAILFRKAFEEVFGLLALAATARAAINDVAILALKPPLSPPTPLPPRRAGKGSQQPDVAACARG